MLYAMTRSCKRLHPVWSHYERDGDCSVAMECGRWLLSHSSTCLRVGTLEDWSRAAKREPRVARAVAMKLTEEPDDPMEEPSHGR